MKIEVSVKPGAKKTEILALGNGKFKVSVKERAHEGRANEALREALAGYFGVARSCVTLERGAKTRTKWICIDGIEKGL